MVISNMILNKHSKLLVDIVKIVKMKFLLSFFIIFSSHVPNIEGKKYLNFELNTNNIKRGRAK